MRFIIIIFCFVFGTQLLGLSTSTPITIDSIPRLSPISGIHLAINEQGKAILNWYRDYDDGYELVSAIKPYQENWSSAEVLAQRVAKSFPRTMQTKIDNEGNIGILWTSDALKNGELLFIEKQKSWPWSRMERIKFAPSSAYFVNTLMDNDRYILSIGSLQEEASNAITLAVRDAITHEVFYTEKGQQGSQYSPSMYVNQQGLAFAVWYEPDGALFGTWYETHQPWTTPELICTANSLDKVKETKVFVDTKSVPTILRIVERDQQKKLQTISYTEAAWQAPIDIASLGKEHIDPITIADEAGNLLVTWIVPTNYGLNKKANLYGIYKPVGKSWSSLMQIAVDIDFAFFNIAWDYDDHFVIVWDKGSFFDENYSVWGVSFSIKDEIWSTPVQLSPAGISCNNNALAFSKNGIGFIAWTRLPPRFDFFSQDKDYKVQVAELKVK